MFFDDLSDLTNIIHQSSSIILAVSEGTVLPVKHPIHIYPQQTTSVPKISIDQAREVISLCSSKQSENLFFVFHQAHTLTEQAENSLLKLIEEPKDHYHFIFITTQPYLLLPTILSRSQIFFLREQNPLKKRPDTTEEILSIAKKFIMPLPSNELVNLANTIHKKKDSRLYALEVLSVAIELAYKSYFATKKPQFLTKIPNFIKAHDSIKANGNVQLQLIANLC